MYFSKKSAQLFLSFVPNSKLKYKGLEDLKADCVNTVIFNLHQIKRRTPGIRNNFRFEIKNGVSYIWLSAVFAGRMECNTGKIRPDILLFG